MSSYYRPYFESPRERRDRERDPGYDRRRYGRRSGGDDFERERSFRDLRARDPYREREWREREPLEPDSHYEGDFGRGRFDQFEDWERPRELASQPGYRRPYGGGGFAGRGPKGYRRSDERLKEEICDRLTADPDIDASEIEVSVENGEVTLEGSMPDRRMKRDAEDCLESIFGVREIHNRIRVGAAAGGAEESTEHDGLGGVSRFWRGAH